MRSWVKGLKKRFEDMRNLYVNFVVNTGAFLYNDIVGVSGF